MRTKIIKSKLKKNEEIRVLMLIDAMNYGGTETHLISLVKKLVQKGIHVVVGTSGGPLMKVLEECYGIRVVNVPLNLNYLWNKNIVSIARNLKQVITDEKINLVHCHLHGSMELGQQIYLNYKIPYIVTLHGLFYNQGFLKATCRNAKAIVVISQPVEKWICDALGESAKDKVVVIPNGVNLENTKQQSIIREELNIPSDNFTITYCSRLDYKKSLIAMALINSAYDLASKFKKLSLIIVGDGANSQIIKSQVELINKELGKNLIQMVGVQNNVMQYYIESDLVIGTGRVALEAMSCKKPVFAVGSEGILGLVSEENKVQQWNMYFGDHNAMEKLDRTMLTRMLGELLLMPERLVLAGQWGRKWCEEIFDEEIVTQKQIELYIKILTT